MFAAAFLAERESGREAHIFHFRSVDERRF
jgi:hypothetical protein